MHQSFRSRYLIAPKRTRCEGKEGSCRKLPYGNHNVPDSHILSLLQALRKGALSFGVRDVLHQSEVPQGFSDFAGLREVCEEVAR
jgi:hypothetical protein